LAAAWSPIISRTRVIPASLFVMTESSCIGDGGRSSGAIDAFDAKY
jgi:hypothetical protein